MEKRIAFKILYQEFSCLQYIFCKYGVPFSAVSGGEKGLVYGKTKGLAYIIIYQTPVSARMAALERAIHGKRG